MADRAAFVEGILADWIDAGMNREEITKAASLLADFCEEADRQGVPLAELVSEGHDKQAFLDVASRVVPVGSALTAAGGSLLNTGLNTAGNVMTNVSGKLIDLTPYLMAGGLVAPAVAGYGGGYLAGALTDRGDEQLEHLQDQELLSALRDTTVRARLRRQLANEDRRTN